MEALSRQMLMSEEQEHDYGTNPILNAMLFLYTFITLYFLYMVEYCVYGWELIEKEYFII